MNRKLKAELDDLFERLDQFLDDQADVADGDYGEAVPNRAMSLMTEVSYLRRQLEREPDDPEGYYAVVRNHNDMPDCVVVETRQQGSTVHGTNVLYRDRSWTITSTIKDWISRDPFLRRDK